MRKISLLVTVVFLLGTVLFAVPSRDTDDDSSGTRQRTTQTTRKKATGTSSSRKSRKSSSKSTTRKKRVRQADPDSTPKPASQSTPDPTPKPTETPSDSTPKPTPTPVDDDADASPTRRRVQPTPTPASTSGDSGASVVIQKSGADDDDDEPAPTPTEQPGFFTRLFKKRSYKYLTPAVLRAIDKPHVQRPRWRYIVVHNSGTRQGNAKAFEYYHRRVRKMPNGLAYHFVIGNGTSSGNGAIEIGQRWSRQINGGHVHSDYLNSIAVGICLVGDFNNQKPTPEQLESLEELIKYLRGRVGKTDRKPAVVKVHKEINPPQWPTDCPGGKFPYRWVSDKFE